MTKKTDRWKLTWKVSGWLTSHSFWNKISRWRSTTTTNIHSRSTTLHLKCDPSFLFLLWTCNLLTTCARDFCRCFQLKCQGVWRKATDTAPRKKDRGKWAASSLAYSGCFPISFTPQDPNKDRCRILISANSFHDDWVFLAVEFVAMQLLDHPGGWDWFHSQDSNGS